jgi:adenylate cyclase
MRIRLKIILTVLPLLIATILLTGIASSYSARAGISRIAVEFLGFKAQELKKYADSQWNLLEVNQLTGRSDYVAAAQSAVLAYARTVVRSETELILALDPEGGIALATGEVALAEAEKSRLLAAMEAGESGWLELSVGGRERVAQAFFFAPWRWYVLVSEETAAFYREVAEITTRSTVILGVSILLSLLLLLVFAGYLTRPVTSMVAIMKKIIQDNDLSRRVPVEFGDEIGTLAHTFNIMTGELEKAYNGIKKYALSAVLAKKQEQEIRNIFQKYVPKNVIDQYFENPEALLVGDTRLLAVLFSDIRSFTSLSEGLKPAELVTSLNSYFSTMVDIVMAREGIVDKYIGDAIMAFFGAPVHHDDDALRALLVALEMHEALAAFNEEQGKRGRPRFRIGIGISYGDVTIGNIGSEKKMDYTVIGDMVNLASRLENLTKAYHQQIIFSENVYARVQGRLPCRMLDKVVVKGKTQGEKIFTAQKTLSVREEKAWAYHHAGLKFYYDREFPRAAKHFNAVRKLLPADMVSALFLERCLNFQKKPPPPDWTGVQVMETK